jgi:hypothetical protein
MYVGKKREKYHSLLDHNFLNTRYLVEIYTGCLKICEFRIQSVVGDHFSSPNMETKKKIWTPPTKIHWSEGALFEVRFLQIQLKSSVFIDIYGVDDCGK